MKSSITLIFCIFALPQLGWAECEDWFAHTGAKAGTKDCKIECSTRSTGFDSIGCNLECDKLCQTYFNPQILDEYSLTNARTSAEKSLIAKHPSQAIKVFIAKQKAESATKRIFHGNFRNDESDAFRHFMWSGLSADSVGSAQAKEFTDAHEAYDKNPIAEKEMDLSNNKSGQMEAEALKASNRLSQETLEKRGLELLQNKKLNVIEPTGEIPAWHP